MRTLLALTAYFLLLSIGTAHAQTITKNELLGRIDKAVNNLNQGQFTFHGSNSKISVGEDTTFRESTSTCLFKKLTSDTLIGYQLSSLRNDGYHQVYDGRTLFTLTPWNKTLETTEGEIYQNKIRDLNNDYFIFPFFKYLNRQIQFYNRDSMLSKVTIHGITNIDNESYYKIQTGASQVSDKNKTEAFVFVSTKTFLPVRQTVIFESIIGQAKEIQTFNYWMSDLETANIPDQRFSKQVLSAYSKEKKFTPVNDENASSLLPVGAVAPPWELPLLTGGKIKLADLKGKVVILDFWYKACVPCQKQMLALQQLHEKFDKKSVSFIGVNTIDDPVRDKLVAFLKNRNVTMPGVYNGRSIEPSYHVYGSPALFVIDKEGKILFTVDGYSDTLLEDVSKIVQQHL